MKDDFTHTILHQTNLDKLNIVGPAKNVLNILDHDPHEVTLGCPAKFPFEYPSIAQIHVIQHPNFSQNWYLLLIWELRSKMSLFCKYLVKCLCFWNLILKKSRYMYNSTLALLSSIHVLSFNFFFSFWKFKWNSRLLILSPTQK